MATYTVTVFTGDHPYADTRNKIFFKLVGDKGVTEEHKFDCDGIKRGSKSTYTLNCRESIGKLVVVELRTQGRPASVFLNLDWFVDKVEVTSPEGQVYKFPIYHWLPNKTNTDGNNEDEAYYYFREGTAMKVFEEVHDIARFSRERDLKYRKIEYIWDEYADGMPYCIKAEEATNLPLEVQFSPMKNGQFYLTAAKAFVKMNFSYWFGRSDPWKSFDDISDAFDKVKDKTSEVVSEKVRQHWREDAFFGDQFLNGLNPMLIRRCTSLPTNFPVTDKMVSLEGGASLTDEMKEGNIFLCDYKNLDGVKANVINGKQQFLAAPLVLLHRTPDKELKPVAIQLKQTPAEDNPIFFPTDSEYDWLLAKTFVRSADFNEHELNVHLLRTHLLGEVFTVALMRNMPKVHPLYKLLMPHTRYNLQINVRARKSLVTKDSNDGLFTKYASSGGEGTVTILQKSMSSVTYSSLCIPDDIKERGLESVPNYYYRDDGLRIWDIMHKFVTGVVTYYYKSDKEVQKDTELQNYIKEIFEYGFLSKKESGIPPSFSTVEELIKFATMVMFTVSAQHSAVNHGQLDFGAWIPNLPITLQLPPPTKKGEATEETLLKTLPDVNASVNGLAVLWLLTTEFEDSVPLGQFPYERFIEDVPIKLMYQLQSDLKKMSDNIASRNKSLKHGYIYLNPKKMENSVAI